MFLSSRVTTTSFWRLTVQWTFFIWILFIGLQFGRFVYHFISQGQTPLVSRPGVEGFTDWRPGGHKVLGTDRLDPSGPSGCRRSVRHVCCHEPAGEKNHSAPGCARLAPFRKQFGNSAKPFLVKTSVSGTGSMYYYAALNTCYFFSFSN